MKTRHGFRDEFDCSVEVLPDRGKPKPKQDPTQKWAKQFLKETVSDVPSKNERVEDWTSAPMWLLRNVAQAIASLHAKTRIEERDLALEFSRIQRTYLNGTLPLKYIWQCQEGFGLPLARKMCRIDPLRKTTETRYQLATSRFIIVVNRCALTIITAYKHKVPFNIWLSVNKRGARMK